MSEATVGPVAEIVTDADADAIGHDPSSSSAVTCSGPLGTTAASMVAWTATLGLGPSTPDGRTNTSDRKTSGTTRSVTSR